MPWLSKPDAASRQRRTGANRADWIDCCLSALTTWYLTGLVAALGFSFGFYLLRPPTRGPIESRDPLDATTWMDGKWYKQIAVEGYHYDRQARSNIAFFPLYPLLGRAAMAVTGLRAEAALLIVSNASFLGALVLLAFYVRGRAPAENAIGGVSPRSAPPNKSAGNARGGVQRIETAINEQADWAVVAAALFPAGCFFRLAYSESTFLLLTVLAMYAMRRRWPLPFIALVIGLATAARPVGVALLAPFVIHLLRRGAGARFAPVGARLAAYVPVACWGLAAFMAYQHFALGDGLAVFKAHDQWRIRPPLPLGEKAVALATFEPIRAVYDSHSAAFWAARDAHGIPWFSLQFANPLFFVCAAVLVGLGAWCRFF